VRVRRELSPPVTYRLLLPRLSMARSCMERVSLQLGSLKRPEAATSASQGGVSPPTVDEELLEELLLLLELLLLDGDVNSAENKSLLAVRVEVLWSYSIVQIWYTSSLPQTWTG
jgi:hypothetical protein